MITRTRFFSVHHSRSARSGPPPDPPPPPAPSSGLWWQLVAVAVLLGGLVVALALQTPTSSTLTYSDFVDRVDAGTVEEVTIDDKGSVYGTLSDGTEFVTQLPTALDLAGLDNKLQAKQVRVSAEQTDDSPWGAILFSMLPFVVFAGLLLWLGRRAQRAFSGGAGGIGGIGTFGRSKARVIEANRPTTRFADVAGYDGVKQEISEVVDFLRDPEKYAAAGAKGPRGVLMIGPPGTGKTLLARAVAGEAEVRFLSVTGSEFVEMFVGVGASRVRDLFEQA
ncbi:ATP-dependent metallopeptidase FtsH/Yme1/Tma family protein, partial [Rhodococcus aetherivorans]|uniref:ATP-dependent metallopeptidase FtsH/Yme1/Tma family protein n=3 Tax=Nocardiaceae TaxID=85025 RepID=UPI0021A93F18